MKTEFSKLSSPDSNGRSKENLALINGLGDDGSHGLRTALSMILNSDLPMALFWGNELNFYHNDSFHSLVKESANGFQISGQSAEEYLNSNWAQIRPQLEEVFSIGRAVKQHIKLSENDSLKSDSFIMHYSPVKNGDEETEGVLVFCEKQSDENHFKNLLNAIPVAVYSCDTQGFIRYYNSAAADLWGKEPELGVDMWCGSLKIYNTDGTLIPLDQCPMAITINEGHEIINREVVVVRKDGKRLNILPHPKPLRNKKGELTGAINMLVDITALKKAENELRENEDRLRLATEAAKIATWELNLVTREIHYSKRLAYIFGLEGDSKLTQFDLHQHIHPDDLKEIVETAFNLALTTGIYYYEARIIHPDKSIHWIRTHGKISFDENQVPKRMLGTMMDITEEKTAEEKVAMLAAIVHSSGDAIISKRLDGTITSWNDSAERIFGYKADEIVGEKIYKLIPPERIDEEALIISQLKRGEVVDHFETQRISKDKKILDISLTISPIVDKEGNFIGASKIARDISKQKLNQKLLKESEQKFKLLADSLFQFIWTCDQHGKINYVNNSILSYSGLSIEKIREGNWIQLLHPDEIEENKIKWKYCLINGKDFLMEQRIRRKDGQYRWHITRIIPQKDVYGKIQMWIGTCADVHDRKVFTETLETQVRNRTKDLNQLNSDLRRSNNELVEFAYVASHDLQEPLRKIQAFSARILQKEMENLTETGKNYLDRMQKAANRMQTLIDDLLAYSRTNTADKIFVPSNLNLLINEVKDELETNIKEKKAILNIQKLPVVKIIPFQFHQLFTNLISNSLKFSREGERPVINISASLVKGKDIKNRQADPSINYHQISVSDNGIGFQPEFNERVFELFYRLHGKSEYSGTGIGLAICQKIANNHRGFMTADGEEGRGATFNIFIPATE